jgi:hypothetical protein
MEKTWLQKTPLTSKKFLFASGVNLIWLMLIGFGISRQISPDNLNAMIYAAALTQSLYLGGQSAVDAFVRGAFARSRTEIKE